MNLSKSRLVLIYAINRTDKWWKFVGENLGFDKSVVISDIRGAGDRDLVNDFYQMYNIQRSKKISIYFLEQQ
jgi:hypothetical protein